MDKVLFDQLGYFKILEVTPDASEENIRQNYRRLAKFWHPDHNKSPNALDMFQALSVAYETLKDKQSRLKYTILSMIYDKANFPDMGALALLYNMHGQQDINLRAIHMIEVTGKGLGHQSINKIYYCNPAEAINVVRNITKHNWLYGFWGITAFGLNIKAILQNLFAFNCDKDNLTLLMHNALVYKAEGKINEAASSAMQAKQYANREQLAYINQFINELGNFELPVIRKWNFAKLRQVQLFYFGGFACLLCLILGIWHLDYLRADNEDKAQVKQVVVFNDGKKTFSDVAVAKIFDIPVDIYDKDKLYHVITKTTAMHGADKGFDAYREVEVGTTVRITGYTTDKAWMRVMFDNGEMAFIETKKLAPGIGNNIPLWSKIYKE